MNKVILNGFLIILFFFLTKNQAQAAVISAGGAGGSISAAVASASSGDTIAIHAGTYKEELKITKPLTLQAAGDGQVWIDGECSRSTGITITSANVAIKGLGVKRTRDQGIIVRNTNSSNITIEGNMVADFNCQDAGENFAAGIASWYGGSKINVLNNTITRRVEIAGNQRGKGNGIWFKSNNQNPSGGGHLIAGNVITGGYDCIGGEEEGSDRGSFDKDSIIENNTVKDCWDDGIQIEGGDVNVTVRNNRIERAGIGIAFAANRIGPLYIQNNTIIGDVNIRGVHGQLACYKLGRGGKGTTYLTANDCRIPGTSNGGDGFTQTNSGLSPIVSSNNVLAVSRYIMEFSGNPPSGSSFDGDCLFTSDTGRFVKWGGGRYGDLKSFQKATGQEIRGSVSSSCPASGANLVSNKPLPTNVPTRVLPTQTSVPTFIPIATVIPSPTSLPITPGEQPRAVKESGWFERMLGTISEWPRSLFGEK